MKEELLFNNITHQQLKTLMQDILLGIFDKIDSLIDLDIYSNLNEMNFDFEISAKTYYEEDFNIVCTVKSRGEPKYIREATYQLLESKERLHKRYGKDFYCVIAAPYISPASSKLCEDNGVGYIDLAGNCLLIHKGIYVRIEGMPNKYKQQRSRRSIFERTSVKSSVILRNLLEDPNKKWRIEELANLSLCSVGQVSKVKKYLDEREFLKEDKAGFFVNNPIQLILDWAKVYNLKPNTIYEGYTIDSTSTIEQKLIDLSNRTGIEYALTGFSGGVRYSPTVRYNKVHVYIPFQDLNEAIYELGCKEVKSGSNISIIVPYDPCVMLGIRNIKNSQVASPIQVCLDLLGLKGRGEEAAQAILDKEFRR